VQQAHGNSVLATNVGRRINQLSCEIRACTTWPTEVILSSDTLGLIEAKPKLTMLSPAFWANAPDAATNAAQAKAIFEIKVMSVSNMLF